MKRSSERILTTHTGSLPRPAELVAMLENHDQRDANKNPRYEAVVKEAVADIVRRQVETGIDVVSDGETSKVGYATYLTDRVTGFSDEIRPPGPQVESATFPEFYRDRPFVGSIRPVCKGPIAWQGDKQVQRDIANFKAALQGANVTEAFMSASSPGIVWQFLSNDYYPSHEAFVFAVADAMKNEYKAIVDAGLIVQIDCPELALGWNQAMYASSSLDEFLKNSEVNVAALNHALEGIPTDRVRMHICWGNSESPHTRDVSLASIWHLIVKVNADAYSFEGANPRHEHEWAFFENTKLPEGKIIIPGVIDSTTNFVEHPELIAQRIERYANLVGRENVIAGSDCGFSTGARSALTVHPTVTWAKFQAMREGAQLASEHLWSKSRAFASVR